MAQDALDQEGPESVPETFDSGDPSLKITRPTANNSGRD